jgi:Zinc-binding dehydrogenase
MWPPVSRLLGAQLRSRIGRQRIGKFMARGTHEDLVALKELAESGKLTPLIDRTYPLREVPDALRCAGTRGVRGKVVIKVARADSRDGALGFGGLGPPSLRGIPTEFPIGTGPLPLSRCT